MGGIAACGPGRSSTSSVAAATAAPAAAREPDDQPAGDRGGNGYRRASATVPALSRPSVLDNTGIDVALSGRGNRGSLKSHANVLR